MIVMFYIPYIFVNSIYHIRTYSLLYFRPMHFPILFNVIALHDCLDTSEEDNSSYTILYIYTNQLKDMSC
jgi:hypothetical protein